MTNGRVRENVSERSWRGQVVLDNRDGVKQNVLSTLCRESRQKIFDRWLSRMFCLFFFLSTLCRESRQKILDRWFLDRWLSRWQNVLST